MLIKLIPIILVAAAVVACLWSRKKKVGASSVLAKEAGRDSFGNVTSGFADLISRYERRFLAVALTAKMSECAVPFTIRKRVWADYPCEYSDPVIGVNTIAHELGISEREVFEMLPDWYQKVGIVSAGELDGELVRRYFHESASKNVDAVLSKYLQSEQFDVE